MVNVSLSGTLIADGRDLLSKLDHKSDLTVDAAYWKVDSNQPAPKLLFSVRERNVQGPTQIYRTIQRLMSKPPVPSQLVFEDIALTTPDEPTATAFHNRGPKISWRDCYISGGLDGDPTAWMYIYRLG